MSLSFVQSLIYGLIAGLTDILPVSAQAHKSILLTIFGTSGEPTVLRFLIHLATLGALYYGCGAQIMRLSRQQKLARIPKNRRKRPVDMRSIMDVRLLKATLLPIIAGFLLCFKTAALWGSLMWNAIFLFVNGALLFIPCLLPSGNKDSRAMSRVDGFMMGLGGAAAALPGISSVGTATSMALVRGADRTYAVNMALLMHIAVTVGQIIFDIVALFTGNAGVLSFGILMGYLLAAVFAFFGAFLGIRLIRSVAVHMGFEAFAYYCWGASFFAFILYLSV